MGEWLLILTLMTSRGIVPVMHMGTPSEARCHEIARAVSESRVHDRTITGGIAGSWRVQYTCTRIGN